MTLQFVPFLVKVETDLFDHREVGGAHAHATTHARPEAFAVEHEGTQAPTSSFGEEVERESVVVFVGLVFLS